MEQLFVAILGVSKDAFRWLCQYWMNFGIIVSILTAVMLGVVQVLDPSDREPFGKEVWTAHDKTMWGVIGTGIIVGWTLPLLFIFIYWFTIAMLPIAIGYAIAKLYKYNRDKVRLPKASIEAQ